MKQSNQEPTMPMKDSMAGGTLKPYWLPPDDEQFLLQNVVEARTRREWPTERQEAPSRPSYGEGPLRPGMKPAAHSDAAHDLRPAQFSTMQRAARKQRTTLRRYVSEVRDVLRTRLRAAYEKDELLRTQERMCAERNRLDMAAENIQNHVEALLHFLEHDCNETQELRKKVEEKGELEGSLEKTYGDLRAQLAASERHVYTLAEKWLKAKVYQNFLVQVSPIWWRKQYDPALQEGEQKETAVVESVEKALQRYQPQPATLDAMLAVFHEDMRAEQSQDEDAGEPRPSPLFFEKPEQLMSVFDAMERHILNSLLLTEELWVPLETMRQDLKQTMADQQQQLEDVNEHIRDLQGSVAWASARARDLEARTLHLLRGRFSNLLVSDDGLALYVCVEDAYEACVGSNDYKLSMIDMMTAVENRYWSLLRELDALPASIVARSRRIVHLEERRRMRKAHLAEQKVQRLHRREYRLMHALQSPPPPPNAAQVRARMARSPMPTLKPPRSLPPPPLTASEHDWLHFRADYCPYTDQPDAFLHDKTALLSSASGTSKSSE